MATSNTESPHHTCGRKSLHVIPIQNNNQTAYLSSAIFNVCGFQIKDISFDNTFVPATSRLWLESNTLSAISATVDGRFNFEPRNIIATWPINPTSLNNIEHTYFHNPNPHRFERFHLALFENNGLLANFNAGHHVQVTIELTHCGCE